MTDGVKRITDLPYLVGTPTGVEVIPVVKSGVTSKYSLSDLAHWMTTFLNLNSPPTSQDFNVTTDDTQLQVTGNLLVGASDPNGDPITLQTLKYNGTVEPFEDGSFQTDLGIFYVNTTTGDWTYTLGPAARSLNIGQTGHEIFTYTLADGRGGLNTSTLTISITGTNSMPVVNYVNGQTPINTTVSGNLIAHYAFDYESALTVLHYQIAGITGTWAAGTAKTISGVGTIEIDTNGDYTFTPADGYTGPVPLITYTLTDVGSTPNTVDAYLTLAVTPLTPGSQPVILKATASGPTHGGEDDKGCYLTIWGFRFGSPSAMGTTTHLKIGGVEVDNYRELIDDPYLTKWPGLKRMRVQVGHLTGLEYGKPYPIVLTVSGNDSNANHTFTPNPGRVFFVSLTGNDDTAVIGDIASPFRSLQKANRGDPSCYPFIQGGDWMVIRGGDWNDIAYDTAWFRFRDPQQQGSNPNGSSGSGYITFTSYPTEDVHYKTPAGGNKGGIQGPGSAFSGSCGDWVQIECLRMEVVGGSARDAAPVNMQYNTGHWKIQGNNFGPWPQGDSEVMNAACVTGQGNFIEIYLNNIHDVEGVPGVLQNHGIYAGTTSYGWDVGFNQFINITGGSAVQANDSDGGTGTATTPYGVWQGFTDFKIHHNYIENCAKYGILFADVGAGTGDLSAIIYNNIIVGTALPAWRLNTTTSTSDITFAFNTLHDCMTTISGTGNAYVRNEGFQGSGHSIKQYNNIFSFGPSTVSGCAWFAGDGAQSTGYSWARNVYFPNGQTPTNVADALGIYGDPKFTNPIAGVRDFSLQPTSPAINAGTQALPAGVIVNDDFTALATRQFGGAPDCGAVEVGQTTPYIIVSPSYSGGPRVGVVTSVTLGTWGNSPTGYSRQFKVDTTLKGSANTGTGSISYTPSGTESGGVLKVEFAVTNGSGTENYTFVIGTIAVGSGAGSFTAPPSITGTPASGQVLSCSSGTFTGGSVSGYTYQWRRVSGSTHTPISGATSSTYTLTNSDVGYNIDCIVGATDTTNGTVYAAATQTAAVAPPPADPVILQSKKFSLPANTATPMAFDSDVSAGSLIFFFGASWDQSFGNFSFLDTQGHSHSDLTYGTQINVMSDNPKMSMAWLRSNASGSYTATMNPQSAGGNSAVIMVEIANPDPTTVLDIPQDTAQSTVAAISLNGGTATTKHNDLILVGVAARTAGHTFTDDTGWTTVQKQDGSYFTLNLFYRKISSNETFAFTTTMDADAGSGVMSAVIKGS